MINPRVGSSQVIAPGSLVGDPSQSSAVKAPAAKTDNGTSDIVADPWADGTEGGVQAPPLGGTSLYRSSTNGQNGNGQNGNGPQSAQIYGKTQVNRLLETLFPHRQALNGTAQGTTGDAALENRP